MKAFILLTTIAVASAGYSGPINQAGLDLIKSFEGWQPNFYLDSVGIKTIGYGHACHVVSCAVPLNGKYTPPLTQQQGLELLASDLNSRGYESCVKNACAGTSINADQYSALVSFAFNLGCGSLQSSTLLKKIKAGDMAGAADQFGVWINSGGKPLEGLIRRRKAEKDLFCSNGACGASSGGSTSTSACSGTVDATSLTIRTGPSATAAVAGSLTKGASVTISGRSVGTDVSGNKNWFQVPGGYASAYYINIVSTNGSSWCSKN